MVALVSAGGTMQDLGREESTSEAAGRGRALGLLSVLALGLNTIIGSGIFRLPAELARDLGAASPLAFVAGALVLLPVAISYARAARALPADGSAYAYTSRAFGPRVGVVVGFSIFVATVTTLASAVVAVPGQLGLARGPRVDGAVGALLVLALGALSSAGVRRAGRVGTPIAIVKTLALATLAVCGLFAARLGVAEHADRALAAGSATGGYGGALLVVVFALSGFEAAAVPGTDTKNASSTLPRAILGSLLLSALVYAVLQVAVLRLAPGLASSERPLADAAGALLGPVATSVVGFLGALSLFGLAHAMAVTAPVVLRALADAWPNAALARLLHRRAVFMTTSLGVALALGLDFRALVDFTSVLVMAQYAMTALAAPLLACDDLRRPATWPLPALGIASSAFVAAHASRIEVSLALASVLPAVFVARRLPRR